MAVVTQVLRKNKNNGSSKHRLKYSEDGLYSSCWTNKWLSQCQDGEGEKMDKRTA